MIREAAFGVLAAALPGSGALPIYVDPFAVLDASVGYSINKHIDVSIDASKRRDHRTALQQHLRPPRRDRSAHQELRSGIFTSELPFEPPASSNSARG